MNWLFAFLVLTTITLLKSPAYAVNYIFAGNLEDSVGTISRGTAFTGSFSYAHPQALEEVSYGNDSSYSVMSGHFSLTIGSETVSIDGIEGGSISVHNRFTVLPPDAPVGMELGVDKFRIVFGRGYPGQEYGFFGGRKVYGLEISLSDASGNVFPDTELPGGEMRLDQFTSALLRVKFQESVGGWYDSTLGTITSLVPEPSAFSLLAIGLGGLVMMRRRRS